jgi:hypothetical protein
VDAVVDERRRRAAVVAINNLAWAMLAGDADPHLERFSRIERPATSQLDG